MNKSRILTIILTALICVSAVSCNKNSNKSSENSSNEASQFATETTEELSEQTTEEQTDTEESTDSKNESPDNPFGKTTDINDYFTPDAPEPALWKVTDDDSGNVMYMMGTIHVASDNAFSLPDYIMDAYENADGVAVEYDINKLSSSLTSLALYQNALLYKDGTTVKDHLSSETYEKAKNYFDDLGVYNEQLDKYTTGYWIQQLNMIMFQRMENLNLTGIDSYFIGLANKDGKEVVSIEELSAQTDALNAYSDDLADYVISDMVDNIDEIEEYTQSVADMYNCWAKGDVDKLQEIDADEMGELPKELEDDYVQYENIILHNRNQVMAQRASEFIENNDNLFYMVGSLHFAGDQGVDDILEDMGYTVEKLH